MTNALTSVEATIFNKDKSKLTYPTILPRRAESYLNHHIVDVKAPDWALETMADY